MKDIEEKFKSEMSQIKMTTSEDSLVRERVLEYAGRTTAERKSLLSPFSFVFNHLTAAIAVMLVVVGLPSYYATANSLPGDLFYPVKTEVVEELQAKLTPEDEKADFHVSLVEKRLEEVVRLVQGENESEIEKAQARIQEHTAEAVEAIKANNDLSTLRELDSYTKLSAALSGHKVVIDNAADQDSIPASFEESLNDNLDTLDELIEETVMSYESESSPEELNGIAQTILQDIASSTSTMVNTSKEREVIETGLTEAMESLAEEKPAEAVADLLESHYLVEVLENIESIQE